MPQIVDRQDAARVAVHIVRAVLGCEEYRHQRRMPVIRNEHHVLAVQLAADLQQQWCLKRRQAQHHEAKLHTE